MTVSQPTAHTENAALASVSATLTTRQGNVPHGEPAIAAM